MNDYFALLGEPRRPRLEPETLKEKFLQLAAKHHPDKLQNIPAGERQAGQESYADLNAAYQALREPKSRVQHLLQLERGEKPRDLQEFPAELTELFFQISGACRQADQTAAELRATPSALLKVPLFERSEEISEQIRGLLQELERRQNENLAALKHLDAQWDGPGAEESTKRLLLDQLENIYRLLGFYSKWAESLRQRLLELAVIE